ncbi:hypothetical protein [Edwardsiella tarda]|uniref:hypothetical protein n=1 Tax=Edwardsiella tarda TaxID=636 RepID=UPI003F65A865
MSCEFIDPSENPYQAAQQTLIELIRAGRIENSSACFDEYKNLLRLYRYIEQQQSLGSND